MDMPTWWPGLRACDLQSAVLTFEVLLVLTQLGLRDMGPFYFVGDVSGSASTWLSSIPGYKNTTATLGSPRSPSV